jgi:HAD superfamily hydrolase (TIGR01490 family)
MSKFAVFDIDGTIIRWQLYHAISDTLIREKQFDKEDFIRVKQARMDWKNRSQKSSYKTYEEALIQAYDKAITKVSYDGFLNAAEKAFDEYKEQTYTYTRELLANLKSKDYKIFAISASQQEVVKKFAQYYKFDDFAGSQYFHTDGAFTGEKHILKSHEKPKALAKMIEKHGVSTKNSIGVGDSESDIPMLKTVDHPIVFNPTSTLLSHAKTNNWDIVIERKDVVYKMSWKGESYEISTANS